MPYITASGVSIPQGTDAYTPPTQFKGWADAEATYDNFLNLNLDSDRLALAAPVLRDGIFCWVRATTTLWTYQGTTWVIAGIGPWTSYTPTFTALTASAVDFQWRREGQLVRVRVKFTCTTQGANNPEFTLPVASEAIYSQFAAQNGVLSRSDSGGTTVALLQAAASGVSTSNVRLYGWGYVALVAGAIPNGHLVQGEFTYRPAS